MATVVPLDLTRRRKRSLSAPPVEGATILLFLGVRYEYDLSGGPTGLGPAGDRQEQSAEPCRRPA